jgi:Uma2 family endonuclease
MAIDPLYTVPAEPIWRLSVGQYHEMINVGILTDEDRVELLEGLLVARTPKTPPHSVVTQLARETLAHLLPPGWHVDAHDPITTEDSEPEPDVAVVRGNRRDYLERHPGPDEVALVIEVADTTLRRDRGLKKRIYARAGIPVYLIINLPESQIEVYTSPTGEAEEPDYQQRQDYGPDDEVPIIIEGREVGRLPAREILP